MTGAVEELSADDVGTIVERLRSGDVLLLPTDTVYGLCCDPFRADAVDRIFEVKGRSRDTPLAVLARSNRDLRACAVTDDRLADYDDRWPGTLTVVVPVGRETTLADGVGVRDEATHTLGLRRPAGGLIAAVVDEFGPLAATSANLHGAEPGTSVPEILEQLLPGVAAFVDGGRLSGVASSVVVLGDDGYRVLRSGALTDDELGSLFGTPPAHS